MDIEEKSKFLIASILRRILLIILIIFSVWAYGLNKFVSEIPMTVADSDTNTDAIVILTGGSKRLNEGIKLLNEGKADKLFVSGVGKEVTLATLFLVNETVYDNMPELAKKIELGYEAENTKGNADEVAHWIKKNNIKSIRLVTANYHMQRSILIFQRKISDIEIIPHPVVPGQFKLEHWWRYASMKKLLITEYDKYLVTKIGFAV